MIGKQTKGTSFGGCVRYVLKEEKSKLLEAVGVEGTPEQMAEQFELQALLNDKVKNIVGHTSLNFSPEDSARLKSDDMTLPVPSARVSRSLHRLETMVPQEMIIETMPA